MSNIDGARRSSVSLHGGVNKNPGVNKTLFTNKTKIAHSGRHGKNPDAVNQQRVATSEKSNEKLTRAFGADLPQVKQQKLKNEGQLPIVGKGERKLGMKARKRNQVERARVFYEKQPYSKKMKTACGQEFSYRATKNKYKDRAKFEEKIASGKLKLDLIPEKKEGEEIAAAATQCKKKLCGLAILSPEFYPDRGFSSLSDLKKAFGSENYLELFVPGATGLDVFLLPEVLDSPEISKVRTPIALAIVATLLRTELDEDSVHDLSMAMRRVSPDFDLSSRPPIEGLSRGQAAKLHVLTSIARTLADSKILSPDQLKSLAELEPLVENVKIAKKEADAMSEAANGDWNLGMAAQDHTRKATGALIKKLNDLVREVSETLDSAADRGLQEANPVELSLDIMGILHTVAGDEGKQMAARSDLGKLAAMRKMQKDALGAL